MEKWEQEGALVTGKITKRYLKEINDGRTKLSKWVSRVKPSLELSELLGDIADEFGRDPNMSEISNMFIFNYVSDWDKCRPILSEFLTKKIVYGDSGLERNECSHQNITYAKINALYDLAASFKFD